MTTDSLQSLRPVHERQCVDWLLTTIRPLLQTRGGGAGDMADPAVSLGHLLRKGSRAEQPFVAELLLVRNAFAHCESIRAERLRWAFDTARLILAVMGATATASRVLRRQRDLFPGHAVGQQLLEELPKRGTKMGSALS